MNRCALLGWVVAGLWVCGYSAETPDAEPLAPDKSVVYKTIDKVELKLHLFTPPGHKASDKRPAIVFFFGGGWKGGNPEQFYPQCRYLADRGMVAMSAEYRIQSKHGTPPSECVKDGKSAVRWIRQNAEKLGVDPNRLAAGGGSAGGHVAAAIGTLTKFDDPADNLAVSCIPNALALFNPVFDNSPEGYGYDRVKDYWQDFSPLHNLNKNTPPTIVFLGTKDRLIPVQTAQAYKKKMEALGIRCDLMLYKDQQHGFFNARNTEYHRETLNELDKFLVSLGYLEKKPE